MKQPLNRAVSVAAAFAAAMAVAPASAQAAAHGASVDRSVSIPAPLLPSPAALSRVEALSPVEMPKVPWGEVWPESTFTEIQP